MRKGAESDKENLTLMSNKKKSFKEMLKEKNKEIEVSDKKEGNDIDPELLKKKSILLQKSSQNNLLLQQSRSTQPATDDNYVSEEQLFPALFSEPSSDVIYDYTIKKDIKINWTSSLDWISSVGYNYEDSIYKTEVHKILDYYIYPAKGFDLRANKLFDTLLSKSTNSNTLVDLDKEWYISLKDWFVKWLDIEDPEGKTVEFSLITKQYKVVFISQTYKKNDENYKKRFAIVGTPEKLTDVLIDYGVNFK